MYSSMFSTVTPGHASDLSSIVELVMQPEMSPAVFSPDRQSLWRLAEPSIWSLASSNEKEDPARSILRTLWDQPRWLEAYHLYDERGSELFEQICELPEYYLTRTENSILQTHAAEIIASLPGEVTLVELGS